MKPLSSIPILEDNVRSKLCKITVYGPKGEVIYRNSGEYLAHVEPKGPGIEIISMIRVKNPKNKKNRKSFEVIFIPWIRILRMVFTHARIYNELIGDEPAKKKHQEKKPDESKGYG